MAMHSGAWTEKFSYPLRQYMTAISPRSLWWKTDADFHHQESVEQTNSWDNISFDPNLQHLQDQRQRGGAPNPSYIHLPPSSQFWRPPPPPKFPVSWYKHSKKARLGNLKTLFLVTQKIRQTSRQGKKKKHSFFNQVLFRTKQNFLRKLHVKVRQFLVNRF